MSTAKQKEIEKIKKDIGDIKVRLAKLAILTGDDAASTAKKLLGGAVSELEALKETVFDNISDAGKQLDEYAREKHWQVGAIAAITGLVSGFLLGRRRD